MAENEGKASLKCRYCTEVLPNPTQLKNHVVAAHADVSRRTPRKAQKSRVGTGTVRSMPGADDMRGVSADHMFDSNDDREDRLNRRGRQEPNFHREWPPRR